MFWNPCILIQCAWFGIWIKSVKPKVKNMWEKKVDKKNFCLFPFGRSWEESSTWMPSHSVCPRLHHEPEQAWKGVLQYRCGRFNFYGFKALPEPQTYWIRSTGNCLVSQKEKKEHCIPKIFIYYHCKGGYFFIHICLLVLNWFALNMMGHGPGKNT